MAAQQQQSGRKVTRFDGVYQRASLTKKYEGKPDIIYVIDYYDPHSGKRIRKTIGSRSQGITAEYANTVRQHILSKAKSEIRSGILPQDTKKVVPTLGQAWEKYKTDWLEAHVKASAYNDASCYKNHLQGHPLHNRPLNKIAVSDLEEFTLQKRREGYSSQTIKHILGQMRRIMNKALVWKLWNGPTPFVEFAMPEVDNERTRFLTEAEAKTLLAKIQEKDTKTWLMCLIAVQCGLRFSEIAKLEVRDLSFENGTLFIRQSKNGRSRFAFMTQTVKSALIDWLADNSTVLVFPSQAGTVLFDVGKAFTEAVEEMKLNEGVTDSRDKFVFHCLRHTFASFLAKNGYGQAIIAELMGHRSLEMTRRYTHLMPDTKRAAAVALDRIIGMEHQASPL